MALSGLSPFPYLEEDSAFRRLMYEAVAERAQQVKADERQDLARRIANVLAKAMR